MHAVSGPLTATLTLLRGATVLLDLGERAVILVDPMLADAGSAPPVQDTAPARRNPLVSLPLPAADVVAAADAVLVTHLHNDHFDAGARALLPADIPLFCQPADAERLTADGFTAVAAVDDRRELARDLELHRVPARHAIGGHEAALAPVSGYVLRAPDAPVVYVAGDCVWCPELAATLDRFAPDIVVVNAGAARFLTQGAISMTSEDVIAVARHAPEATVVAVHLEALNHCPMTRDELRRHLVAAGLAERVRVPADGETLELGGA